MTNSDSFRSWDNCAQEWDERNEIVVQTRIARISPPLFYVLPSTLQYKHILLRVPFPDSVKPSCGACERDLLGSFGIWLDSTSFSTTSSTTSTVTDADPTLDSGDTSPAVGLKKTYADTVEVVEGVCGFVTSGSTTGGSGAVGSHASGRGV
ncbi:hypothetical protein D9758_014872 [Tetrapyrgos nigripes]|uniref:Uncharacterized protein n=1 Tax=Tetrapyrgos nigripes TaxID=182062 RepID=A0A8H5FSM7_9AGAR|nr:hypothetical protein D9758_014872 [Tetrapyrgos nigripes]